MDMSKEGNIRIGIIGIGGIACGVHIPNLQSSKGCEITAICDIDEKKLKDKGDELGIPESLRFTDYKALIDSDSVDAVEVCTPNLYHPEMAEYALLKGKPVNVEKPIGLSIEHCRPMIEAQKKTGTPAMVCFSYRFRPSVRYAKKLIENNSLGEIMSVNVQYFKDSGLWEGRRLEWRFDKNLGGTGVLGDLGVHLIDLVTYLLGDITEVFGKIEVLVKERKKLDSEEMAPVTTDDACNFIATLANGKSANFSISRCALGNANTIKFEVFGTEGILSVDLNTPDILNVCIGEADRECKGLHSIKVPAKYSRNQEQTFVDIARGIPTDTHPTLEDGMRCQAILDAVLMSSEQKRAVRIDEIM